MNNEHWTRRLHTEGGFSYQDAHKIAKAAPLLREMLKEIEAKEEAEPEPPPVEIPRRVFDRRNGECGKVEEGWNGDVLASRGCSVLVPVAWDNGIRTNIPSCYIIELQLSREEQARLLLEKLSREDWREEKPRDIVYWVDIRGKVSDGLIECRSLWTPLFRSHGSAVAARTTIIRAGLAWWEEGE